MCNVGMLGRCQSSPLGGASAEHLRISNAQGSSQARRGLKWDSPGPVVLCVLGPANEQRACLGHPTPVSSLKGNLAINSSAALDPGGPCFKTQLHLTFRISLSLKQEKPHTHNQLGGGGKSINQSINHSEEGWGVSRRYALARTNQCS